MLEALHRAVFLGVPCIVAPAASTTHDFLGGLVALSANAAHNLLHGIEVVFVVGDQRFCFLFSLRGRHLFAV